MKRTQTTNVPVPEKPYEEGQACPECNSDIVERTSGQPYSLGRKFLCCSKRGCKGVFMWTTPPVDPEKKSSGVKRSRSPPPQNNPEMTVIKSTLDTIDRRTSQTQRIVDDMQEAIEVLTEMLRSKRRRSSPIDNDL